MATPIAEISLTTANQRLSATSLPCRKVVVQADPNNAGDVLVGMGGTPTFPVKLPPAASVDLDVQDAMHVVVKSTAASGDKCGAIVYT